MLRDNKTAQVDIIIPLELLILRYVHKYKLKASMKEISYNLHLYFFYISVIINFTKKVHNIIILPCDKYYLKVYIDIINFPEFIN